MELKKKTEMLDPCILHNRAWLETR